MISRWLDPSATAVIPAENTMRWAVELPAASGGTGPTVTVDAESWKSALTEARGGRGLTKFRVDFEEDGTVRVHDLVSNERFCLSPSSNALTSGAASAPVVAPPAAAAAVAPVAQPTPSPAISAPQPPKASIVPPPGPTGRPSSAGMQSVVPPPAPKPSSPALQAIAAAPTPATTAPSPPVAPQPQPAAEPPAATVAAAPAPAEVVVAAPGVLFFSRDREAASSNGITDRERLIAVPQGSGPEISAAIARDVSKQLRDSLAPLPAGKFISIAVFDHQFKSRPERPPIVVLGWKDWRGDEPDITISRPSSASISAVSASIPPNSFAPPAPPLAPAPAAQTTAPEPPVTAAPVAAPPAASVTVAAPPKHTVAFSAMPDAVAAHIASMAAAPSTASAAPPNVEVAAPAAPAQEPVAARPVAAQPEATQTRVDAVAIAEPAPALLSEPVAPVPLVATSAAIPLVHPAHDTPEATLVDQPRVVATPSPTPSTAPPPAPSSVAPPPSPQPTQPTPSAPLAPPSTRPPAPAAKKQSRHRGDDLLSEAFDALSDMAFLSESSQATDFAAQVAKDLLHTPFIAISLYDIDRHELSIECCDAAPAAKGRRLRVAKGETRSDVLLRGLPAVSTRWQPDALLNEAPIGPALLVSIALDRRLFGVLELHREMGEHEFEHDEEGAASYIAGQLAQFLADHSKRVGFQEDKSPARRK